MKLVAIMTVASVFMLNGCARTPSAEDGVGTPVASGPCRGDALAAFIGQKASSELGQHMLKASGAAKLRWVPPRSAVTMDFRPDRLTVSYDDEMTVTRLSCG